MMTVVKPCAVCGESGGAANVTVTVPYSYCPVQTLPATVVAVPAVGGGCVDGSFGVNNVKVTTTAVATATATTMVVPALFTGGARMVSVGLEVLVLSMGLILATLL
jgi:hypothetical protein